MCCARKLALSWPALMVGVGVCVLVVAAVSRIFSRHVDQWNPKMASRPVCNMLEGTDRFPSMAHNSCSSQFPQRPLHEQVILTSLLRLQLTKSYSTTLGALPDDRRRALAAILRHASHWWLEAFRQHRLLPARLDAVTV